MALARMQWRLPVPSHKGAFIVCSAPEVPVELAATQLDAGEASALALALTAEATVLLDEMRGRRVAADLAIPVVGFCGLLILAKRQGLIAAVLPYLHQARAGGYFLSDELLTKVARMANE